MSVNMKYLYIPVCARNVWIPDDTEQYLLELQKRAANEKVKKWITSNLRKFIINTAKLPDVNSNTSINKSTYPQWVKDKIDKEKIYYAARNTLESEYNLLHVIDYLNSLNSNISNMGVPEVLKQVKEWDKKLKLQDEIVFEDGFKPIKKYSDGFSWVSVYGKKSLEREGALMKHCVGGKEYYNNVTDGKIKIFSLRDKQNIPHVTIEYDVPDNEIIQIKGKTNTVPQKYKEKITDFLFSKDFKIDPFNKDITSLGFVVINGVLIDIDNYHGNLIDKDARININCLGNIQKRSYPKIDVEKLTIKNCSKLDIKNIKAYKAVFDDCIFISNTVMTIEDLIQFKYCVCKKIKVSSYRLQCKQSDMELISSNIGTLYIRGSSCHFMISNSQIKSFCLEENPNLVLGDNVIIEKLNPDYEYGMKCLRHIPDNLVVKEGDFIIDANNLPSLGKNINIHTLCIDNYSSLSKEELSNIREHIKYKELLKEG